MNLYAGLPIGAIIGIAIGVVLVILVVAFAAWWISTKNRLHKEELTVDESASGIDVALTKRFDLLTKTVATVKGYAKHEAETLKGVIEMRRPADTASMQEKGAFATSMTKAFDSINIVAERYPELKANQNFMALQGQIAEVEEQLQAARRVYNANVKSFNYSIVAFPSSIVANSMKLLKREFFEAEESKRQDVTIEF